MFGNLTEKLNSALHVLKGHGKITEINIAETLKEVRRALLDADVSFKIAKEFTNTIKEKAIGRNVLTDLHPGQLMVKIVKDELTSLKGTLVPATTINKTISKIPMLGEILVGKKIGEGVFGVSFKIKGPPKKLKTTVNPIKTLTPRFITRTLEKISN